MLTLNVFSSMDVARTVSAARTKPVSMANVLRRASADRTRCVTFRTTNLSADAHRDTRETPEWDAVPRQTRAIRTHAV